MWLWVKPSTGSVRFSIIRWIVCLCCVLVTLFIVVLPTHNISETCFTSKLGKSFNYGKLDCEKNHWILCFSLNLSSVVLDRYDDCLQFNPKQKHKLPLIISANPIIKQNTFPWILFNLFIHPHQPHPTIQSISYTYLGFSIEFSSSFNYWLKYL